MFQDSTVGCLSLGALLSSLVRGRVGLLEEEEVVLGLLQVVLEVCPIYHHLKPSRMK